MSASVLKGERDMDVNLIDITYTVKRNGSNHFFFISDQILESLNLPINIKDEIASFGASAETEAWPYLNIQTVALHKLRTLFQDNWDVSLGLPRFRFDGDTEKLGDELRHRSLLLFIPFESPDEDLLAMYASALSFCSKVVFQSTNFMSTDHKAIGTYLRQQRYDRQIAQIKKVSADFALRMQSWYTDTWLHDQLMASAKIAIETFLTQKQLNLFIPNFLVVPVYHIRRYQKALSLITDTYSPNFTMTLPITVDKKNYTVLFPISYKNLKE